MIDSAAIATNNVANKVAPTNEKVHPIANKNAGFREPLTPFGSLQVTMVPNENAMTDTKLAT